MAEPVELSVSDPRPGVQKPECGARFQAVARPLRRAMHPAISARQRPLQPHAQTDPGRAGARVGQDGCGIHVTFLVIIRMPPRQPPGRGCARSLRTRLFEERDDPPPSPARLGHGPALAVPAAPRRLPQHPARRGPRPPGRRPGRRRQGRWRRQHPAGRRDDHRSADGHGRARRRPRCRARGADRPHSGRSGGLPERLGPGGHHHPHRRGALPAADRRGGRGAHPRSALSRGDGRPDRRAAELRLHPPAHRHRTGAGRLDARAAAGPGLDRSARQDPGPNRSLLRRPA